METLWRELTSGLPDGPRLAQVVVRLSFAVIAGAIIGYERERAGKAAGLRTHMLVTLGTTVFVLSGVLFGMQEDALSRVIQGIVTGIGFIGAGSILKLQEQNDIKGLTTAAGVWMTAAIGVTIGLGQIGVAMITVVMTLIVLAFLRGFEKKDEEEP